MGNLWIKVNYAVISALVKQLQSTLYLLGKALDEAGASETTQPGVCERDDCPHRLKNKGGGECHNQTTQDHRTS
jgi:hypothetical protein